MGPRWYKKKKKKKKVVCVDRFASFFHAVILVLCDAVLFRFHLETFDIFPCFNIKRKQWQKI